MENTIYKIDLKNRKILMPLSEMIIGVEGDKDVHTISFKVERTYENIDLADFAVSIKYENGNGKTGEYYATNVIFQDDDMYFDWLIEAPICYKAGFINFSVVFTKTTVEGEIEKRLTIKKTKVKVLDSCNGTNSPIDTDENKNIILALQSQVQSLQSSVGKNITEINNLKLQYDDLKKQVDKNTEELFGLDELVGEVS